MVRPVLQDKIINDKETIAVFVSKLLKAGLHCKSATDAVLFFITLATVLTLAITSLVTALANPIASYAVGVGLKLGFSALVSASKDCK